MAAPDSANLIEVVRELTSATVSRELQWAKVNPTTFSWTNPNGRIVMQRVISSSRAAQILAAGGAVDRFHLEVFDASGGTQLSVLTGKDSEVDQAFQDLFSAISSSMTAKGVDFLRQLVKGGGSNDSGEAP